MYEFIIHKKALNINKQIHFTEDNNNYVDVCDEEEEATFKQFKKCGKIIILWRHTSLKALRFLDDHFETLRIEE